MAQIIRFPEQPGTANRQFETEKARLENVRRYHLQFVLNHSIEIAYTVFDIMESRGIKLMANDKIDLDMLMVCESIKAAMLRSLDIDHPLHDITEEIINRQEGQVFREQWHLHMTEPDEYE